MASVLLLVEAGSIADQAIAQIRTIYSFVAENKELKAYTESLQTTLKLGYKGGMAKGLGIGCTYGIAFMSRALVFWYAGVFIRNGVSDGGKAFTAIFSAIVGGMCLGQAVSNLAAFEKGKVSGYKLMEIIRQQPTISQNVSEGNKLPEIQGNIEFKNITFSYPSRPDVLVFRNFSIHIPAGKTVAMVGGSGSGKSMVVTLIERFYDPNQGQVLLDGQDLKTLQLKWLRQKVGLVNQELALFATTILENILYGKADATKEEVEAAATAANAHSFISLLPEGYNTQVLPSLRETHDEFMLKELVKRWGNHKVMVRWLSRFFNYLERFYLSRNLLPKLNEAGLKCFQDLLSLKTVYQQVKDNVKYVVITLIVHEREGGQIDRALLKNVLDFFVEIEMDQLEFYEKDFESPMLDDTTSYYSRKAASWILEDSCPDYMLKAEECLKREKERVAHYLHCSSEHKLLERVQNELLSRY